MTTAQIVLSDRDFQTLSRGRGDAATTNTLVTAQASRNLLLLRFVAQAWPTDVDDRDAPLAVLAEAQRQQPSAVCDIFAEPMVGAWAARVARKLIESRAPTHQLVADLDHLSRVALAAALRSGIDADLAVHTCDRLLPIPTYGAAVLPGPERAKVRARIRAGTVVLDHPSATVVVPRDQVGDLTGWLPAWRMDGTSENVTPPVVLDDLDPYRAAYGIPVTGRLLPAEARRWTARFGQAWRLLVRRSPHRASELAGGVRALVPLSQQRDGVARSATVRDAFGACGLTLPRSAADLAVTLVHEFQHSKLNGVLDLAVLYELDPHTTYFAPWRHDPRPIGGLFQGVYAFLGVADLWSCLLDDRLLGRGAAQDLATVREQVHCGLESLVTSGLLTRQGRQFASGLGEALRQLFTVDLPPAVVDQARRALRDNLASWRLRNGRTD